MTALAGLWVLPWIALSSLSGGASLAQTEPAARSATTAPSAPARPPRYIEPRPYDFADHAGWRPMFDGRSLAGWEGTAGAWRIEDGAITSSVEVDDAARPPSVYLFWKGDDGGDLADFEFKTEVKLEGARANSGVQFRALMLGSNGKRDSEWESFGYQADMDFANVQTGALIECCAGPRRGPSPRPFRASMGLSLRIGAVAGEAPSVIGAIGDATALKQTIHVGGWNQLHIVARGHVLLYYMNGYLMSAVLDDDPTRFLAHGRLAIQLEGGGARKVSFRNLWLKTVK